MRMLVHYQAYGDATKVPELVALHSQRIREQINQREHVEIERLEAEYSEHAARLARLQATGDADELLKHARVVEMDEIEENEFNLNILRYVDTFEPEPRVEVKDALKTLAEAENALKVNDLELINLIKEIGYV